jgi:class 3 adenylate cyclase
MELPADRGPEDARATLDPVFECVMAAVHHHEGTVNQVMRAGIMALFGVPIEHEGHAVWACHAALAMQTSLKHYCWRSTTDTRRPDSQPGRTQ